MNITLKGTITIRANLVTPLKKDFVLVIPADWHRNNKNESIRLLTDDIATELLRKFCSSATPEIGEIVTWVEFEMPYLAKCARAFRVSPSIFEGLTPEAQFAVGEVIDECNRDVERLVEQLVSIHKSNFEIDFFCEIGRWQIQ